jgi:hypothetical protein
VNDFESLDPGAKALDVVDCGVPPSMEILTSKPLAAVPPLALLL